MQSSVSLVIGIINDRSTISLYCVISLRSFLFSPVATTVTCIIFDGKTIAADRLLTRDDKIYGEEKKILKWSRGVWASAGRVDDSADFPNWLEDRDYDFQPHKSFDAIYTEDGEVYHIQDNLIPMPAYVPTGIGVAGEDAELLVKVGFTARQAVKALMKVHVTVGGKIDTVKVSD